MSTSAIVEALRTLTSEIVRSEEFRTALRDVVSEMLAARPRAVEMVPVATFAYERLFNEATVRQMAKEFSRNRSRDPDLGMIPKVI